MRIAAMEAAALAEALGVRHAELWGRHAAGEALLLLLLMLGRWAGRLLPQGLGQIILSHLLLLLLHKLLQDLLLKALVMHVAASF
jgi:hypothetical protein